MSDFLDFFLLGIRYGCYQFVFIVMVVHGDGLFYGFIIGFCVILIILDDWELSLLESHDAVCRNCNFKITFFGCGLYVCRQLRQVLRKSFARLLIVHTDRQSDSITVFLFVIYYPKH